MLTLDETKTIDHYLEVKDLFLDKYLPDIKNNLNKILDDELHKKILYWAKFFTTFSWATDSRYKQRIPSIEEVKSNLIKLYKRYNKVYNSGLMPPGKTRIIQDPTYENFKNRMTLVNKDFYSITDLDK